ncbi:MAG: NAD(+) kinase [Gammaproteobacteria bacterium]|nr:NAD(+) kinase [Gammaproteobacteria bacterium]
MATSTFSCVGIIGRQGNPHINDSLEAVHTTLRSRNCEVLVENESAEMLRGRDVRAVARDEIHACDLIVVVGGDGSILGVARDFAQSQIPVVGVNRGTFGFLADISPNEIEKQLHRVLDGDYRFEEHFLIQQTVHRGTEIAHESSALNDVVVSSGSQSRMMEFRLSIDDEFVYEQRSDGLLVSSPTGSTAYSLSAGGPIMHPRLDAIAIIPMYPHTLTSRPIVVPGNFKLRVEVGHSTHGARTSSDSQVDFDLAPNDVIEISKHQHVLKLIHLTTHSFYEACRSKLDWGSRLGLRPD